MPRLNSKGLLVPDDDQLQGAQLEGGGAAAGGPENVTSPLAANPTLAGGAAGVQKLDYGGALADVGKSYAWDAEYGAMDQALQRKLANMQFTKDNQYSQLTEGYQKSTAEAERQRAIAMEALNDRMSSQGMGWSGIKTRLGGELEGDYQRYVGSLGDQYRGGINSAENAFGMGLGDIAAQREVNWQGQAVKEDNRRREDARLAAEAKERQDNAQRDYDLQQQYINDRMQSDWQFQQLAEQQRVANELAYSNSIRAPAATGGGGAAADNTWSGDFSNWSMDDLTALYNEPTTPEYMRLAARKKISSMSTPGSPDYYTTPVGHRDNPYGFYGGSGGMAL